MNMDGEGFQCLNSKFPRISDAKIKEGIFIGSQIRELIKDIVFKTKLNEVEERAWTAFVNVCYSFLGNKKDENYHHTIQELISAYKALKFNMPLKIHFLDSHLDFFPENLGAVSDEHGERFHQDMLYIERRKLTRETTDCQPQLIEEYILETERDDNEGRRVVYHIKLSIFQRPSNSEYLGELYVDRDYREGIRNGESCRFPLGTRVHANRYIQQFTEIFTEEGRKAVKITHLVPGHLPKVTHTGITPEQRQALMLQQQQLQLQQQRQAAMLAAQQQQQAIQQTIAQQQTEQQFVVVGPNGQQQHLLPTTVQHLNTSTAVQHVLRHQQMQHQQQVATAQFIDANAAAVQLQHTSLTATA
ncbi:hypothetical protein EVAR_72793_1 [Eumeta japonica]|uniref:Uncharacterized protein n=1 Tax=Eumeta variegata TaxID=151549 RepID=A0A4C1TE12_EUMVA|nr:hypothetical protein EVAR_72793_1 [Eumeta japonica]